MSQVQQAQPQDLSMDGLPLHTYQKKKRSFQGPAINFDAIEIWVLSNFCRSEMKQSVTDTINDLKNFRYVYRFVCDLQSLLGYTPEELHAMVDLQPLVKKEDDH